MASPVAFDAYLQTPGLESSGSQALDKCLVRFVRDGLIEMSEALRHANDPVQVRERLVNLPAEPA